MASDASRPAARPPIEARRRRRRIIVGTILGIVTLFVVSALWVAWDALTVEREMRAAAERVETLRSRVIASDDVGSAVTLEALQTHAAAADSRTSRPHWWLMAQVPGIGPTIGAVRTVASVTHDLADDALPALVDATTVVNPRTLAPKDGRIDLGPLLDVAPSVVLADRTVQTSAARLEGIRTERLFGPVSGPVEQVRGMLEEVAMTTATASRAAQLLPPMLGADGPRQYLLLVQNPAEIRAGGGMPGAMVLLTADDGRLEFTDKYTATGYRFIPPLPITDEERNIYSDRLGIFMSAVTFTPDFPRSAELAREMVTRNEGVSVDGVLSVDPVALQSVLGATGPVTLPDGQVLDGENTADVLMNQIYFRVEGNEAQDAYFADAARATFEALTDGAGNPGAAIEALAGAARDGRLRAWSTVEDEQALLSGTVLSGELFGERDGAPEVGVYFNDGTATKLDYYLRYSVQAERTQCNADGTRVVTLDVTMANTAPANAPTFPSSVLGEYDLVAPGVLRTNLMVYGPSNGWIGATYVGSFIHGDQHVVMKTVELAPGQSESFRFEVLTGNDQEGPLRLNVTPGAVPADVSLSDYPCA